MIDFSALSRRRFTARLCLLATAAACILGAAALPARASSDDAWAELGRNVTKACRGATGKTFVKPDVIVDPFGSETYALAIVTGKLKAGGRASYICLYDKKTGKTQLGSELGEDRVKVMAVPKP